jgi:hypothetical protein
LQDFFKSCKQFEIKKLLIRDVNLLETTLNVIKDFVKGKNLEFLAYRIENFLFDKVLHKRLEKLIDETTMKLDHLLKWFNIMI